MSTTDIDNEREKIRREIEELEKSLGPGIPSIEVEVSDSSLESDSDDEDNLEDDDYSRINVDMEVDPGGENGINGDVDINLPRNPETCLQMNLVYQEVIQEKIEEITFLLAENKEQQEKLMWELAGKKRMKSGDGKCVPANMFLGHFMKPYFKDKTSGIGPPANSDAREKATQGIKSFEELITVKWKTQEKLLLRQSVVSDHLQHLLQPKLLKLDYLNDKRAKCKDEIGRQILEKQIQETEYEINDINQLPELALLGSRLDEHDWDKIANINFEGMRNAKELRKYWQNSEHPSINKEEWSQEETKELQEIAARHNCLDWEAIAKELGTGRSAFHCLQKFQAYNKDFKRSEWTPEEDLMLMQLVQEMRVGNHIPYRKICYYMEGRDSCQALYRWTKRVDPSLRRGAWTPEEDALLLKAVSKYGERDWYKIRTEVPGRNDIQCRERYLHSLHDDIKKGKWSAEEEMKLIQLTEKYGVGNWAQIASELPHRSGGQCLSKWKVMLGYRRNRGKKLRQKRRCTHRASLSLSESSSEDSDLDLASAEEEEPKSPQKAKAAVPLRVPSIDLWIPTSKVLFEMQPKGLAAVTLLSKGFDENRKQKPTPCALGDGEQHQAAEGPAGSELKTVQVTPTGVTEKAAEKSSKNSRSMPDSWRVSLSYVKSVLRQNGYKLQKRTRELRRKRRFDPSRAVAPAAREAFRDQEQKPGLWKTTLNRRLMMAVTPWAGSMVQAWALRVKMEASRKSKAEFISRQLQAVSLTSTPLFTLLIQLLRIDTSGCMKIIQKRRSKQSELLKTVIGTTESTKQDPPAQDVQAQPRVQECNFLFGKKLFPLKAKEHVGVPTFPWNLLPPQPTPKPKTVSELLREKRQRELKAKRVEQKRVILAPQLLLPSSVMIQQQTVPTLQARSGRQAAGLPGPTGARSLPASSHVAASVPAVPSLGSTSASPQEARGGSQKMATWRNECEDPALGSKDESRLPKESREANSAPASFPKQAQVPLQVSAAAAAAEPPSPIASQYPAGVGSGPKEVSSSAPLPCAVGTPGSRQNTITLVPTLVASQPGPSVAPKHVLPITWVLTPQGLVPLAIVSIPSQNKQPVCAPGQALPVSVAPVAAELNKQHPGPQLQGASSSRPQKEGASRQMDFGPSSLDQAPATPREAQSNAPTACPPVPPSPSISLGRAPPSAPVLKLAPQPHALRSSPHPATVEASPDPTAQSCNACPMPSPPQEEVSPDYGLISLEEAAAVKEWASGASPVGAPSSGTSLPYLPPFLGTLKTLSALLLKKEALEECAASLVTPEAQQEEEDTERPDTHELRAMVRQRLKENPAYQLLRARFMAAMAFPAALAVLPPFRVTTTLSGSRWWESSHEGDSSLSSEEEEGCSEPGRESGGALAALGRAAAASKGKEDPGTESANSDQFSAPVMRRSMRLRKRRWQL